MTSETPDPYDMRVAIGEQAMNFADLWDEDMIRVAEEFRESARELAGRLTAGGMPESDAAGVLAGMVIKYVVRDAG